MSIVKECFAAFLFSDIEDSTKLWEEFPVEMKGHIVRHDAIVDGLIEQFGGKVIDHAGDGVFAVFEAGDPMGCALEIQCQLQAQDWGTVGELRIRMGLHAGKAKKRGEDYRGPLVNRTARIMSTAWGGQIVVTPDVVKAFAVPSGASLQELGYHTLKGLSDPQPIQGLVHPKLTIQEFPSLRSLSAHPNNLPPQPNDFIGREKELAQISDLFKRSNRLVTLLGPGGMGKTRLALQAAAEGVEQFPHGVYFVHLATSSSTDSMVSAIAEALKFTFYSHQTPKDQLINYLREKEMLLVLDNLEHLMDSLELLETMLLQAPKLQLLATSRERLNLTEESILEVEGFELPSLEIESGVDFESNSTTKLFQERALQVFPDFLWQEEDKPHFVRICRLVGGLPLGIELAAAWVRMLPCQEIADEIEKKIDFLASTHRNIPARHRSLRAVFEYSWNLMDPDERQVFSCLSVFRGTFDRQAAAAIANASLLTLTHLLDKSLIRKTITGRFYVLEVLRQFGQEALDQNKPLAHSVKDAHGQHHAKLLAKLAPQLREKNQHNALETLQVNLENIRAAWAWWEEQGAVEQLSESLDPLFLFYERRSRFQEAERLFADTLETIHRTEKTEKQRSLLGKLCIRQGYFLYRLGTYDKAKMLLDRGLALSESNDSERAFGLNYLGTLALIQGNQETAHDLLQKSLVLRQALEDDFGIAACLSNLGSVAYLKRDYQSARQHYQESLTLSKSKEDLWSIAAVKNNLGEIARLLGELDEAHALYEDSLSLCQQLDDRWGIAAAYNNLGTVAYMRQNWDKAKGLHQESLKIRKELGDRIGTAVSLSNLGVVCFEKGAYEDALKLQSDSIELRKNLGDRQGAATTLCGLGKTLLALTHVENAISILMEGIGLASEAEATPVILGGLTTLAEALFQRDHAEIATSTLSFVSHHDQSSPALKGQIENIFAQYAPELTHQALTTPKIPDQTIKTILKQITKIYP